MSRTKYSIWYPFYNYCTSKTFSNEFQAFREETLKSTYYFHKNWILSKNELGPTLLSLKTFSNECQTFRKETEQIIFSRGIQQLRGQNCAIFCPPPPCVDIFHTLSVDKNRHLTFDPLPASSCPRLYWMAPTDFHKMHLIIDLLKALLLMCKSDSLLLTFMNTYNKVLFFQSPLFHSCFRQQIFNKNLFVAIQYLSIK